jgi:hypothetical protein
LGFRLGYFLVKKLSRQITGKVFDFYCMPKSTKKPVSKPVAKTVKKVENVAKSTPKVIQTIDNKKVVKTESQKKVNLAKIESTSKKSSISTKPISKIVKKSAPVEAKKVEKTVAKNNLAGNKPKITKSKFFGRIVALVAGVVILISLIAAIYLNNNNARKFFDKIERVQGVAIDKRETDKLYTNLAANQYATQTEISSDTYTVENQWNGVNTLNPTFVFLFDGGENKNLTADQKPIYTISATVVKLKSAGIGKWSIDSKNEYQIYNKTLDEVKKLAKGNFWEDSNKENIVNISKLYAFIKQSQDEKNAFDNTAPTAGINQGILQEKYGIGLLNSQYETYGSNVPDYSKIKKNKELRVPFEQKYLEILQAKKSEIEGVYNKLTPELQTANKQKITDWTNAALFQIQENYYVEATNLSDPDVKQAARPDYDAQLEQRKTYYNESQAKEASIRDELTKLVV